MAADHLAARRRRAVADRSASIAAGSPAPDPATPQELAEPPGGWADLVVLLPSADAATVLLLCAEAAELSG